MTCSGRSRILALMANVLPTVLFAATMLGGDFNGAENLVFANRNFQHNQVCLGDGRGRFTCADISPHSFNSFAVAVGDVNGDGRTDAVFANSAQPNRVCLADKTGSLACVDINTDTLRSFEVALGDLNKDGNLDAVFANFDEPNHVCLGDGRGSFSCSDISEDSFATAGVAISTSSRKDLAHAH